MRDVFLLALAFTAALFSPVLPADDTLCESAKENLLNATNNAQRTIALDALAGNGCLGGEHDPAAKALIEALDDPTRFPSDRALRNAAIEHVDELIERANDFRPRSAGSNFGEAAAQLAARLRELAQYLEEEESGTPPSYAQQEQWDFQNGDVPLLDPPNLITTTTNGLCASTPATCAAASGDAMSLIGISEAATRILHAVYYALSEQQISDMLQVADRNWEGYFGETRTQLPWELVFNSWIYGNRKQDYCRKAGGFCSPPEYQWILLHPSLAVEYLDDVPDGQKMDEALVLELFGINRWSYAERGGVKGGLGISLAVIASDRVIGDTLEPGLMFHFQNQWSLGVTRREDTYGIFLSYEFWQSPRGRLEKWRTRFESN